MVRKKLERPCAEQINSMISSMLVPSHILTYFEIWDAHEYSDRWVIEMREKEGRIPSELSGFTEAVGVESSMEKFGDDLQQIKNMSMDMSSTYAPAF
jgi:hypothetical protein